MISFSSENFCKLNSDEIIRIRDFFRYRKSRGLITGSNVRRIVDKLDNYLYHEKRHLEFRILSWIGK